MYNLKKIIKINLLFLLSVLGVVTIPASIISYFSCSYKLILGNEIDVKEEYFKSLKKEFFLGIKITILYLPILMYSFIKSIQIQHPLYIVVANIILVLYIYSLSLASRYELNITALLKNTILLFIINGINSVFLVALSSIIFMVLIVSIYFLPLIIIYLILFGGYIYVFSKFSIDAYYNTFEKK